MERGSGGWSGQQQKEVMFYGDYVHRIAPLSSSPMNNGRTVPNFRPPAEREGSSITKAWDEFGIVDTSSFA